MELSDSLINQDHIELAPECALSLGRFIVKITNAESEQAIYVTLAQHLNELIPNDRTSVTLLNADDTALDIFALSGSEGVMPVGMSLPINNTLVGNALHRQTTISNRLGSDSPETDAQALLAGGLTACMNAALVVQEKAIGTLNCAVNDPARFDHHSLELLSLVARLVSINLERRRLLQQRSNAVSQYQRYAQQLETVNRTAQEVTATTTESDLLRVISEAIQEILPAQRTSYAVYDEATHSFSISRLSGRRAVEGHAAISAENSSLGWVLNQNRSLFIANMSQTEYPEHQSLSEAGLISGWSIPVRCNGTVTSILNVATAIEVADGDRLTRVLETLAAFIGKTLERIQAQQRVAYQANYDPLTSLPNRHLFNRALKQMAQLCQRSPFALLFIDLDRFKAVNDSLGHRVGDQLLQKVAKRILKVVRENDMVARLGGDEFVVLLPGKEASQKASATAQRIITTLSMPFSLEGHHLFIGASIGISLAPEHTTDEADLVKFADIAMYRAKALGRNLYQFYSGQLSEQIRYRQQLHSALHNAIENDELYLLFQPQLLGKRVIAIEALLRWQNPELGRVSPGDFIPLAEESSLIEKLTGWVLEQSLTTIKQLRNSQPDLYVAVNISAQDCHNPDELLMTVQTALQRHQLPGDALELEITENIYLHDTDAANQLFVQLKAMGIRIAIDDFGTGFSSLTYLHRLPLDTLKIDQSFVQELDSDPTKRGIVSGIMTIANSLSIECLAEGVETPSQLQQLEHLGCERFQGYLFSRPVSADEFRQRFLRQQTADCSG